MKKYFYFFGLTIIVLLTSSCSDTGVVEKPENLIEEERMEQILYDLLMLDAMNTFNPKHPDFEAVYGTPYLYKKYGIDSLQLAESDVGDNDEFQLRTYSEHDVITWLSADKSYNNRF